MRKLLFTFAMIATIGCTLEKNEQLQNKKEVSASDCAIDYVGRVKKSTDGSVSFDWAGVYARTLFSGNSISMIASDSKYSEYNVYVDGKFVRKIDVKGSESTILLADSLSDGTHSLTIQKRTEGMEGRTSIKSFVIGVNDSLSAMSRKPSRLIEFIGNSITCGYGTESNVIDHPYDPRTANSNKSFGAILGRYFEADYVLTSHSGQGMAKNWSEPNSVSEYTMRDRFLKTFDEGDENWDFKAYHPDLVVLSLGTNDFSTPPHPGKKQFLDATSTLIGSIRKHYGEIPVLLVSPLAGEPTLGYIKEFVKSRGDDNIHMCALDESFIDPDPDYGPTYHPTYVGHQKMAMTMIPYISKIMKWQLSPKPIL